MKKTCCFCLVLFFASLAVAQGTRLWKESSYDEFERGTAKGVAIGSSGKLELAPAFKVLYTSPSTFIWSIAADKDGAVYAATGAPARVYRITPDGKGAVIFEPKELQVQAIAIGGDGAVYAATSPDGKVYRLTRSKGSGSAAEFTSELFFDPKTKYIWDMEFDSQGRLYLATGDRGEIYRVERNGQGAVFFKSDEAHIRVLAFDPKGNLIAGSDGSGLIYRITPSGEGFVLYSAPKKEITALAVDASGNIFASGTGEKKSFPQSGGSTAPIPLINVPMQPGAPGNSPLPPNVNLVGSDVYTIAPDGSPRKLWSSHDDIVYALAFDAGGHLIAGTGNKGRIYSIATSGEFVDLLKGSANQVTAFSKAPNGGLYCSSSNLGKIFLMSNAPEAEGTFESDVQDASIFSRWGRAEVRARGNYEIFARSGNVDNPDRNWSPWTRVDVNKDSRLDVPAARFVQWRAILKPATPSTQIEEVGINYLSKNVAPVVDDVAVQVGARFPSQAHMSSSDTVTVGFGPSSPSSPPHVESPSSAIRDRAYVAVRWAAHDDNDDELEYSIYYRGENEREWKLLKSGITDKFYSFESNLLPDGGYVLKVVASDAPSHTPQDALTDEKESTRFEVDNTPPKIQNLAAKIEGQQMHVTFLASDDISSIKRAEYSIDAGEWQYLEPVGQLSDSKSENYDFNALLATPEPTLDEQTEQKHGRSAKKSSPPITEHVVVVRVYDRYDNEATAKYIVR
jgi:WD40 repeat protein